MQEITSLIITVCLQADPSACLPVSFMDAIGSVDECKAAVTKLDMVTDLAVELEANGLIVAGWECRSNIKRQDA